MLPRGDEYNLRGRSAVGESKVRSPRIVYVAYGDAVHHHEVVFSYMTALAHLKDRHQAIDFIVYTDRPDEYKNTDLTINVVSTSQWLAWQEPTGLCHRAKIEVLRDSMASNPVPTVLLDSDTYFMKSPLLLFERITPGVALMHIREGAVRYSLDPTFAALPGIVNSFALTLPDRSPVYFNRDWNMYNAGVLGLHPSHARLLPEVLQLTDDLHNRLPLVLAEQIAFGYVLNTRAKVREADDVVYHFHAWALRHPFRERLVDLMTSVSSLPRDEKIRQLMAHRPRYWFKRRVKMHLIYAAQKLGYLRHQIRANV